MGEQVEAVLWDMDGTLVDTEPYWIESGRYIREHGGIDLEPAEIVEELLDRVVAHVERRVPWQPGAVELLADLRADGVRCALVTMSYRRFVAPILAGLPEGTFEVVVTGDAVTRGKPHPEPYEKAAAILGVDPRRTLAIEDSNTGARSAEAAGCTVLVVPNHVPVLPGDRRIFRQSLVGLTHSTLPRPIAD